MCCTRLAGNTGRKNDAKNRHLRTIAQLCRAISSQLRHISTIGKKLVKQQYLPTYPYNMVNFGRPTSGWDRFVSLGHPANFDGFRVLTALLHSQTAALNRGRHLYLAGRPSRWALAHISSCFCCFRFSFFGTKPRHCLGRMSPKWHILCWVRHKTLTLSTNSANLIAWQSVYFSCWARAFFVNLECVCLFVVSTLLMVAL